MEMVGLYLKMNAAVDHQLYTIINSIKSASYHNNF